MKTDAEKLAEVEKVYRELQNLADHSALLRDDAYYATEALRKALGLPEVEDEYY